MHVVLRLINVTAYTSPSKYPPVFGTTQRLPTAQYQSDSTQETRITLTNYSVVHTSRPEYLSDRGSQAACYGFCLRHVLHVAGTLLPRAGLPTRTLSSANYHPRVRPQVHLVVRSLPYVETSASKSATQTDPATPTEDRRT